jgi:opacity protein-like surface antigen
MLRTSTILKAAALLLAIAAFGAFSYGADLKIVVKVKSANVRLKSATDSPVVGNARMGLILDVREKVKDWYLVELPADGNGAAVRDYIHKSVVQEFDDQAPGAKTEPVVTTKLSGTIPAVTPAKSKKSTEAAGVSRKRLYIRLGGGYGTKSFVYDNSWSFDMYQESGQASEKYSVTASGAAFDVGLGFMFTRSVGVELSFIPASGKSEGTFSASFPHPFYLNYPRTKKWTDGGLKYSASEINLDLVYAFPVSSKFGLYVMAGGTCFLGVKIESLKVIKWTETGYPYMDLNITPRYASYSGNAFGFNGGGGLDYRLSDFLAVNLNARFSSGSAKIKVEAKEITILPGGIRATAGIKLGL